MNSVKNVNKNVKEVRAPYGSIKEFQYRFLLENWYKSNMEISRVWGCTEGHVSRVRGQLRRTEEFERMIKDRFMSYMADPDIDKLAKFRAVTRLLSIIINQQPENAQQIQNELKVQEEEMRVRESLRVYEQLLGKGDHIQ